MYNMNNFKRLDPFTDEKDGEVNFFVLILMK